MIVAKEFAVLAPCTLTVRLGPDRRVPTCQLHMRMFKDGDTIFIEPFRAKAFPVIKDLVVDRSAFDRIQQAGGFVSINTSGIHRCKCNSNP
jgi:succinate dehydrogenase/fumarate reductase-like Fe-S protein